jgi:O-antigen/teichoic acid export membrane protein
VIGQQLNLPAWTIQVSASLIFLSTLRPIAAGTLQGRENFIAFGCTRLALSLGRIILLFFLVQAGWGLTGAVIALPFGWLVSVLCAFLLLGRSFWMRKGFIAKKLLREGWKLSFYALLAYIAYMSLTSLDLVWVNQNLPGGLAGAYAGLVLMRRIVALLPGVAVTVMFPRVVRTLAEGKLPSRILAQTAAIIFVVSGTLSLFYFIFRDQLITIIFGRDYQAAAPLLGWMGVAMIGISLSSVWLNFYLAEKPRNFVILLGVAIALEWTLLNLLPLSIQSAVLAFGLTGWLLSFAGLAVYLFNSWRLPRRTSAVSQ